MTWLKDSNTHLNKSEQDSSKSDQERVVMCPFDAKSEFDKLKGLLYGSKKWTAEEQANYFAFFCHGWNGRVKEGAWQ